MPKRISNAQREEIINGFLNGKSINELSIEFGYTKLTISRNLKKKFGDEEYMKLLKEQKTFEINKEKSIDLEKKSEDKLIDKSFQENKEKDNANQSYDDNKFLQSSSFMEIVPLDLDIDNAKRQELSSIPICEIDLPKVVYMIVDKKVELETRPLRDYPEWQFLPEEDLMKITIEIYSDIKDAKRNCKKDQKVLKVPNPNVFKVASKIMLSRGISRIISDKQLIAL